MLSTNKILETLQAESGAHEAHHVALRYRLHRRNKQGESREIVVEILDAGPRVPPNIRYMVLAYDEAGRHVVSNATSSPEDELLTMQWHRLDTDDYVDPALAGRR